MIKQPFKFKVIIGGVLAVLFPVIIIGFFSVNKASNALMEAGKIKVKQVALDLSTMTELYLDQEIKFAELMSADPLVTNAVEKIHEQGIENALIETKALSQFLTMNFKQVGKDYELFYTVNEEGIATADSKGGVLAAKKISVAERDYFKAAKAGKTKIIGDPLKSKVSGEPVYVVAIPLKTKSGQFAGMLGITVKLSGLSDKITQVKLGKTGYPFMSDKTGLAIAHPKKEIIFKLNLKNLKGMGKIGSKMLSQKTGVDEYLFKGIKKIAGYAPVPTTGWSICVTQDKNEFMAAAFDIRNMICLVGTISLVLTVLAVLWFTKSIMAQLGSDPSEIVKVADSIAKGDLTVEFNTDGKKIMGVYGNMEKMTKNLTGMFKDISDGVQTLTSSSTELSAISQQMASGSQQSSEKANNVATAAEEMSTNMNSVATATEQTTVNLQMIVSAAEEMSVTVNEIAKNIAKGSQTTSEAVSNAGNISKKVEELGMAASKIGKVTDTISDISEQTNLLALNATIEAARAGEAGKGFAVVAGEIKELAKQTAEATKEISSNIQNVQTTTEESVAAIESIVSIINEINTIVTSVATAIEEQSVTTQEISTNVSQAAIGVQEVNENVNQTSSVVGEVTEDIHKVSQSADEINNGSVQVNSSAAELFKLAENLNEMVDRFKLN